MELAAVSSGLVTACVESDRLLIEVVGYFDQRVHSQFLAALNFLSPSICEIRFNLSQCSGIDSTGLGMLLIARDRSGLTKDALVLSNVPSDIWRTLKFANFQQLFTI